MLNPVIVAVLLMTVLCLLKVNVLIAIMVSGLVGGMLGGLGMAETIEILIGGMGKNAETALSYILLGTIAVAISRTQIVEFVAQGLSRFIKDKKILLLFLISFIGCFSQNLIPIHIAYMPILIPPLLNLMNTLQLDRRAMACGLSFSVQWPYLTLPFGFGWIFHGIIADALVQNGVNMLRTEVWKGMLIPSLGMIVGLLVAVLFSYRKPREYEYRHADVISSEYVNIHFIRVEWGTLIAVIVVFVIQIISKSLPIAGLAGIIVLVISGALKFHDVDETMIEGIRLMGFFAFVMLVAAGFAELIKATGAVDRLVQSSVAVIGGNKLIGTVVMLLIGLSVTMCIGTSFGTILVLAPVYVPLCVQLGFSPLAIVSILGTAGALGDAGSPASDTTLGPTSALNVDGQHDHIWDTCVPTFIHYNFPLLIFGTTAAMIL